MTWVSKLRQRLSALKMLELRKYHVILVTGGSGSGKSEYAENLLEKEKEKLYIATMEPFGRDAAMRIERHRKLRERKGFQTLECYRNLAMAAEGLSKESPSVLLECMSNLVANELYTQDGRMNDTEQVKEAVLSGVKALVRGSGRLVIVTNEVSSDINGYSEETILYQKVLGEINQALSLQADEVYEVVYGIPVRLK